MERISEPWHVLSGQKTNLVKDTVSRGSKVTFLPDARVIGSSARLDPPFRYDWLSGSHIVTGAKRYM